MYCDDFLNNKLLRRKEENAFRVLKMAGSNSIDFCSNDYLGIVHHHRLQAKAGLCSGSTGSRLLTGNYEIIEEAEKEIAAFHDADAALLFNSGFDANTGVLSSVPQKGDTILYDRLSHASIRDGIRLSFADAFSFGHNNLADLETKLQKAKGNIFVVTESVFSMDGDMAPLRGMNLLCKKYNAHMIIDEAHATGVIGADGSGVVQEHQLQKETFCRIHTFGKAVGAHGAVVLGSARLKEYLVNFSRNFIYSTALPETDVDVIQQSYRLFPGMHEERKKLGLLITYFREQEFIYEKIDSVTAIQGIIVPGNDAVKALAVRLQEAGFDIRPVLYPTVEKGRERLRVILHAFNSKEEIDSLVKVINAG